MGFLGDVVGNGLGVGGSNVNTGDPGSAPPQGILNGVLSGGNTPQARGYGIATPPPFQPHSTGPGLQWYGYDPFAQTRGTNQGMDLTGPGYGEQQFLATQPRYGQSAMMDYWGQVQQAAPPTPGSNYSEQEYLNFQRPDVGLKAGLDPYYDRARETAADALNNQFASRGMFGSSAALGQLGETMADLGAQQANREADYRLNALNEMRAWDALGGQLAGQADSSSRANNQNELSWMNSLGNLAGAADSAQLNRLTSAQQAAQAAQALREGRIGDYFARTSMLPQMMGSMQMNTFNQMMGRDLQLMEQAIMAQLGLAGEALGQDRRREEDFMSDSERSLDMFSQFMGMMGGMGDAGGMGNIMGNAF